MNRSIEASFTYHAPNPDQVIRYKILRDMGKELAKTIDANCPPSAEATLAIRKVEEAIMWANKSIACNEPS